MISNMKELQDCLIDQFVMANKVFIVGHNNPDFDAIGASIGLSTLANHFNVESYIIVDDDYSKIEPGAKKVIDESQNRFHFITRSEFLQLVDSNSLLIVTDTNKKNMISIGNDLDCFSSIVVIDHHNTGEDSISTKNMYVSPQESSACEIVSKILNHMNVPYDSNVASYLLAGISLDTHRFKQNTTSQTHDVAEKLIDHGADIDFVNNLFLEEFDSFCRISNLIINGTTIQKYSESLLTPLQVSFTLDRNHPKNIYLKEDYAKAADRMMKFHGIDASFAFGFVDPKTIHVSARSGKRVNVGAIMTKLNGGGNFQSAGGRYVTDDIFSIEKMLMEGIYYGISPEESVIDAPQLIKKQQIEG